MRYSVVPTPSLHLGAPNSYRDFLSLPKTSAKIREIRFPIFSGKISVLCSMPAFFIDNKQAYDLSMMMEIA